MLVLTRGTEIVMVSVDKAAIDAMKEPGDVVLDQASLSDDQLSYVQSAVDRDGLCDWSFRPEGWTLKS